MTDKGSGVLYALFGVAKAHSKHYCYPSQAHILYLTRKYEKISMSRRTLNRVIKKLESEGYIERIRRHTKKRDGSLWLRSTLYKLKRKAYVWLGVLRRWVNGFLGLSAVPKVAQYNSLREKVMLETVSPEEDQLVLKERDGSFSRYGPGNGT
jgi:hypothetical protein